MKLWRWLRNDQDTARRRSRLGVLIALAWFVPLGIAAGVLRLLLGSVPGWLVPLWAMAGLVLAFAAEWFVVKNDL